MLLITLGITFLIIAVYLLILYPVQSAQLKRRSAETEGHVTEIREKYVRRRGTTYFIDFEYTVDGNVQTLKNVRWPLKPDEKVMIAYNPSKPGDAHVKEFRTANPKVFLIIGLILVVLSVILVVVGSVS